MARFPHAAQILQSVYQATGGGTGEVNVFIGPSLPANQPLTMDKQDIDDGDLHQMLLPS
jgi:hypothetical protein